MENTLEIWKPIAKFNGVWEISNLGNVRRCAYERKKFEQIVLASGVVVNMPTRSRQYPAKAISQFVLRGYYAVTVFWADKRYLLIPHREVANAFLENLELKPEVNHKDCNKLNNRLDNLEWCTRSENQIHAIQMGRTANRTNGKQLITKQIKSDILIEVWKGLSVRDVSLKSKVSVSTVKKIVRQSKEAPTLSRPSEGVIQYTLSGELIAEYKSFREASRVTGVAHSAISDCAKGKYKTAGGYHWAIRHGYADQLLEYVNI